MQKSNTRTPVFRFDNGWIIKIGRGLDYFKRPQVRTKLHECLLYDATQQPVFRYLRNHLHFLLQGTFSIGSCDYDLRQCHETTVDIFHNEHTKTLRES